MKDSKLAIICGFSTAVLGCSSQPEPVEWRPFKDIDGTIQYVSFETMERVYLGEKKATPVYLAYIAQQFGDQKVKNKLGQMYPLGKAGENTAMATIFLMNGKSHKPFQVEDIQALAQANSFDFYEFGSLRVSHAKFTAKSQICQDFTGKNGVDLLMTTNYYPENSFTDFYTALIAVKLHKAHPPKELGYTPSFSGNNARLQREMKTEEQKQGKPLTLANVKEKASLLFNIICK